MRSNERHKRRSSARTWAAPCSFSASLRQGSSKQQASLTPPTPSKSLFMNLVSAHASNHDGITHASRTDAVSRVVFSATEIKGEASTVSFLTHEGGKEPTGTRKKSADTSVNNHTSNNNGAVSISIKSNSNTNNMSGLPLRPKSFVPLASPRLAKTSFTRSHERAGSKVRSLASIAVCKTERGFGKETAHSGNEQARKEQRRRELYAWNKELRLRQQTTVTVDAV
ncbi:hypothetical protein TcG_02338 [Trypanosoma cruzi]|nr:hypothetical protein TcG_02338 [Trypanosoma cruzi]